MSMDRRRLRRRLAAALVAAGSVVALLPAGPVWATDQPVLVSCDPAQGTRLAAAPEQVRLVFNHLPDLTTRITVTGPPGVVASGIPLLLGQTASQALPYGLPDGDYVVQFSAHFGVFGSLAGTVGFAVGPAPSPVPAPSTASAPPRNLARADARPPSPARPTAGRFPPSATPSATGASTTATATAAGTSPPPAMRAASASSAGHGWSLPLPWPVTIALLLAVTGFGVERWGWGARDRARLRRSATGSPSES
jgi:copper resistance protein C